MKIKGMMTNYFISLIIGILMREIITFVISGGLSNDNIFSKCLFIIMLSAMLILLLWTDIEIEEIKDRIDIIPRLRRHPVIALPRIDPNLPSMYRSIRSL